MMVTPRATPTMKATLNKPSAPLMNWVMNVFSFIRRITANKIEEPRNKVDISSNHQSFSTTPPIIIRKVKRNNNNKSLVRIANLGTAATVSEIAG